MLTIPSSFVVSSKLSPLHPEDVDRLVRLVQTYWDEECVGDIMTQHPQQPLVAAGISNPQDLSRVLTTGVPVIHLERECSSLQLSQRRYWQGTQRQQAIGYVCSSLLWGACGSVFVMPMSKHQRWLDKLPAPVVYGGTTMAVVGLGLYTAQLLRSLRYNYSTVLLDNEYFLLRDDALQSTSRYLLKTLVPYCALVVATFSYCRHRLLVQG
ncbi:hypothetical protein DM01DRAFT_1411732 [Hesseltinella vesiculosa]|uniref:Uncharacterized protein n=1 Tax=Hesseltinella vesiculosa TaxID=101127 RepID=A0A1X2G3Q9_9FUNG|nr:hypothetical protein DM01DRAFT_1411732 [Hesseltinella vesiculosa]